MISIKRMTSEDINSYKNDMEAFDDAQWACEVIDEFINDPYAYFLCASRNGESAGYCSVYHNTMNAQQFCKIMDVRVKPLFRRKGVAKALMFYALDLAKTLGLDRTKLEVDTQNAAAIALYEMLGFRIEETEQEFYDDGGDAYIMWRDENV